MDKKIKTVLVCGAVVAAVYVVGSMVVSSVGAAVGLGLVAGGGYLAYKKYKQVKSRSISQGSMKMENAPVYKANRPALKEADAEFMFSSNSQRKDL